MSEISQINKPQQARSQRTMTRLLDAAEALLEEKSWSALTIQDVVSRAGSSVGAFYGRFKDKDGLLHALDERYFDEMIEMIEAAVARPQWATMTLAETIAVLAQLTVELHSQKQGLMRTLILQARLVNDPRFRAREERLNSYVPQLLALILAHCDEIQHEDPATAVQFGFLQMFYTAREMLLWPHLAESMPYQGEELAAALARAFLGYLRVELAPIGE